MIVVPITVRAVAGVIPVWIVTMVTVIALAIRITGISIPTIPCTAGQR